MAKAKPTETTTSGAETASLPDPAPTTTQEEKRHEKGPGLARRQSSRPARQPRPPQPDQYDLVDPEDEDRAYEESLKPKPQPAPAPAASHSRMSEDEVSEWRQEARDLGMPEEDIARYSGQALAGIVRHFWRARERQYQTVQASGPGESAGVDAGRGSPSPLPSASPGRPAPEATPEAPKLDLSKYADLVDENVLAAIQDAVNFALARVPDVGELKTQVKGMVEAGERRQADSVADVIDEFFEELGPGYEKYFGQGTRHDLAQGGPEHQRRIMVLQQAKLDFKNAPAPRQLKKQLGEAVRLIYGGQAASDSRANADAGYGPGSAAVPRPERPVPPKDAATGRFTKPPAPRPVAEEPAESGPTPEEWDQAALRTPTNYRPSSAPKGEASARRMIRDKYFGPNGALTAADEADLDGFPGS